MRGISRRGFDILFSLISLILLFPFFLVSVVLTLVFEGRPIFFVQERVGKDLKPIRVGKIRTMHNGAPDQHESLADQRFQESGDFYIGTGIDHRVTPLGRILRRTSIDEYPQLVSVLFGRMSLVGPRPMLPSEIKYLDETQRLRFGVKPGLTGLAQVTSRRKLHAKDSLALDVEYVKRQSALLDLYIVLKTPWVMIRGTGDE